MTALRFALCVMGLSLMLPTATVAAEKAAAGTTYQIKHNLTVKKLPEGCKSVRVWFWVPDDDDAQKVLNLSVDKAPTGYTLSRDACYGHRYLYAEVKAPGNSDVALATSFLIHRNPVSIELDPANVGSITDAHRTLFAEYLRRDVPNMEVDARMMELANKICGEETNVITQARKLFDFVVDNSNHYSKPGAPKSSGIGSATYCVDKNGGGCTDQHGLFIALARARGIPTRLHFGSRLTPQNAGKDFDPGYRCWVTFFAPNYGWVPVEVSAANTTPDKRNFFFGGLDDRRIRFAEGRDLDLCPKQAGARLNLLIVAYVEVDGKPHKDFERVVHFDEVKNASAKR